MKIRAPSFKCKFFNLCKGIAKLFRFKIRKPLFIRSLHNRHPKPETDKSTYTRRVSKILTAMRSLRRPKDVDQVMELKSFSDAGHHKAPYPSPLTPAYVRMAALNERDISIQEDIEDACRSFENYLIDMITEEGKMRDLVDVEELLYCWNNLKSPVFIDLVCRFYGELCKDLFSSSRDEISASPKRHLL